MRVTYMYDEQSHISSRSMQIKLTL